MCVIVYKPADQKFDEAALRLCMAANKDGAGLMYPVKNGVQIDKGFFVWASFADALAKAPTGVPMVAHFRRATSGVISAGMAHPYPLSSRKRHISKTRLLASAALAHNGIVQSLEFDKQTLRYTSDTALLAREILAPLSDKDRHESLDALSKAGNGRFALMNEGGETYLYGYFTVLNGLSYSNLLWQPRPTPIVHAYTPAVAYTSPDRDWGPRPHPTQPVEEQEHGWEPSRGTPGNFFCWRCGLLTEDPATETYPCIPNYDMQAFWGVSTRGGGWKVTQ